VFKNPDSEETKRLRAEIDAENKRREEAKSTGIMSAEDYSKLMLNWTTSWLSNPDSDETKQLRAKIDEENKRREITQSNT
jgi:hypothetical protein